MPRKAEPARQRPKSAPPQSRRRKTTASQVPPAEPITKMAQCLALLRRQRGATAQDLMDVTGWQAHSVRGFLSGTVRKRLGHTLRSERSGTEPRRYYVDA